MEFTAFKKQLLKMDIISIIQLIEEKLGRSRSFDCLNKMTYTQLEESRNFLLQEYNQFILTNHNK